MLFTKVELQTISQIVNKIIYHFCLIKALKLFLLEIFTIKCNNKQTIRLLIENLTKLQTKLHDVNIHFH